MTMAMLISECHTKDLKEKLWLEANFHLTASTRAGSLQASQDDKPLIGKLIYSKPNLFPCTGFWSRSDSYKSLEKNHRVDLQQRKGEGEKRRKTE